MSVEDLEQRLAKLEKALTEIDTARAQLVEEIQTLRLHAVIQRLNARHAAFIGDRMSQANGDVGVQIG